MGMPAVEFWTAEMVRALPEDGKRYETVHGELLVTPAPRLLHQEVVRRLIVALSAYLDREPVGHALMAPADLSWRPDTLVQPDVFVAPPDQVRTQDWKRIRDLILVVEVLSPATVRHDRFTKRRLYQEAGIPLYWLIDADARLAEIWTPEAVFPVIEREALCWNPAGATAPFDLTLEELFRPI